MKRVERIASNGGGLSLTDNAKFGRSIAPLGDLNGDGILDLAIGAVGDKAGSKETGAVHIVFLKGSEVQVDLTHP